MSQQFQAKKSFLVSAVLAATLAFGGTAQAEKLIQPLSGVDTLLTTIVTKSKITGSLEKDANGNLTMDANGFKFNFSGKVYYPLTNPLNGQLMATSGPTGTVAGQASFPMDFAMLAINVYGWLQNGADPAQMPVIPAKINWGMNDLTIVQGGTTYRPITDPAGLGLEGRAFTGFGPVEIGQILNGPNGMSMSVRMGGCIAMKAVSGPHTGKIGTQCLNGTFTFDLSGIDLGNPMASTLNGTGTSNCWMVLQKPMM